MNGKGDKPRFLADEQYRNNYNKIFGDQMKDVRGTVLKIGKRVCIQEDISSVNGMLYKNTICKVEALDESKLQVQDKSGKLWWIGYNQVSASFL
tara:strand:- start:295 stop:576 length:282 start_codon:yes stop_codon:yes gene_type:complete